MYCYPRVFRRKKGIMCYRSPSVHPSVRLVVGPSVRQQFTIISSWYTFDSRSRPICVIPLCIHMLATYLKFSTSSRNNSDFIDFTQKCNFSVNFSKNFKCMRGSHKHQLSNGFYHQITIKKRNIDGGGR